MRAGCPRPRSCELIEKTAFFRAQVVESTRAKIEKINKFTASQRAGRPRYVQRIAAFAWASHTCLQVRDDAACPIACRKDAKRSQLISISSVCRLTQKESRIAIFYEQTPHRHVARRGLGCGRPRSLRNLRGSKAVISSAKSMGKQTLRKRLKAGYLAN